MFCAPMRAWVLRAASTRTGSDVIGGQRTASTLCWPEMKGRNAERKAVDSEGVLYIFQLAAISSLRICLEYSILQAAREAEKKVSCVLSLMIIERLSKPLVVG